MTIKLGVNWFFGGTVIYLWHAWILIDPGRGTEEAEGKPIVTAPGIPAHTDIFRLGRRPSLTINGSPEKLGSLSKTSNKYVGSWHSTKSFPGSIRASPRPHSHQPAMAPDRHSRSEHLAPQKQSREQSWLPQWNSHAAHSPSCRMPWDSVR